MSPPQSAVDIVKILRLIRRIDTPLHLLSIMSHRKDVVSEKIVVRSFLSVSSLNFLLANESPDWQVVCPRLVVRAERSRWLRKISYRR